MPELIIDVTPLIKVEVMLDRLIAGEMPQTKQAMRKASVLLFDKWRGDALHTPGLYRRKDYLDGLQRDTSIQHIDDLAIDIVHTSPELAKKVHDGFPPYDMKPDLTGTLKGEALPSAPGRTGNSTLIYNKKGNIVGRKNVIPFRHKVADTPQSVISSKIEPTYSIAGEKTKWGGRLTDIQLKKIMTHPSTERAFKALVKSRQARKLKAPTYEEFGKRFRGMVRKVKSYDKATQSVRMTFRTVSVRTDGGGSPADSWIHPGWRGINFPREVLISLGAEVSVIIQEGVLADFNSL